MSRTRYKTFEHTYPYFVTCTIVGWLPVFSNRESAEIALRSLQFLQEQQRLTLFGYVLLENHFHAIAKADDLAKEIGDFKSFTARQVIDRFISRGAKDVLQQLRYYRAAHKSDREYQLWQEGYHPQEIQDDAMMWQKLEYIHNNPVRRGYVDEATQWRYSSARNYAKMAGLVPVETEW
jgi:putative transposase